MRKKIAARSTLAIVLCLAIFSTGCTLKQVAEVNAKIAIAVQGFQQIEITLHQDGKITSAEHRAIQQAILKMAGVGMALDAGIIAGDSKATLASKAAAFTDAFTNLNATTLGVKNPESVAEFQIAMASLKVLADSLAGLVK